MKGKVSPKVGDVLKFTALPKAIIDEHGIKIDTNALHVVIMVEKGKGLDPKGLFGDEKYCVIIRRLSSGGNYRWRQPVNNFIEGDPEDMYCEIVDCKPFIFSTWD